jgi:PPOX class probable F420-dependent enzyme
MLYIRRMAHEDVLDFIREHHRAVLATYRRDGQVQLSPVAATVDSEGRVVVSTRETAVKARNLRRDPRASVCVLNEGFFGEWHVVEGRVEIVALPEAMEPLVDYYRRTAGEHPDWDEYRAAMTNERRVLVRLSVERSGPREQG